jgi:hypothetical protein
MATLDKKSITEELEQLQLEETRERVYEMRRLREQKTVRAANRDRDIMENLNQQRAIQSQCWHKKGGKGRENLLHGNDANYAVIKHTLSHGPTLIFCQRCSRVWEPPDTRLNAPKATAEQKALYKKLHEEYQWAANLPTDNEPSGTQLFVFSSIPTQPQEATA